MASTTTPSLQSLALFCLGLILTTTVIAAEHPRLRDISAAECGECHQQIYQQWKSSMHAQSTALSDPIHAAFYNAVIGPADQEGVRKKGKYPVCLQCHAPGAAKDGKTDLTSNPLYAEGVSCVSCHSFTKFKGTQKPDGGLRLGLQAYEYTDDALQGPSGRSIHPQTTATGKAAPMFKIEGNPDMLKTDAVCMGCHDQRRNFNKVALCQTGGEVAMAPGTVDCQLCHMPAANGFIDHSFMGGHNHKMVAKGLAVTMEMTGSETDKVARVSLRNKLPHSFPTGAPFRNVYLVVTATDTAGTEVWKSTQSHPLKDDPKSVLMYKLGDAEGKPAPPPKATQVLGDTRLKPHETRIFEYALPTGLDVESVRAEVFYDLLLPGNKKKFADKIPQELRQPKLIATAVRSL